jgi:hypothetical protein
MVHILFQMQSQAHLFSSQQLTEPPPGGRSRAKLSISQPRSPVQLKNSRFLYGLLFDMLIHFSCFSFYLSSHPMETRVQHPFIPHYPWFTPTTQGAPRLIALLLSSYGNLLNTCIRELIFHNPFQKVLLLLSEFCQNENSILSNASHLA